MIKQKESIIKDFPKLLSPFERKEMGTGYFCIPVFRQEFEWIFDENVCIAPEKFDGTNVSILITDGVITGAWNRKERLPFFNKGKTYIIEGLLKSYEKKYMEFLGDGQHFGELIGKKLQGNPYEIDGHLWLPFKRVREKYKYMFWHGFVKDELDLTEDFNKCPQLLEKISELFKVLKSRWFITKGIEGDYFAEGIVFYNKETGEFCKLRRDMFNWFTTKPHNWKMYKDDKQRQ